MAIDFAAYSPGRRAEIEACASEVRGLSAQMHDMLPLCDHDPSADCVDCREILNLHRKLTIKQAQLNTLMTMAAMDALIKSMTSSLSVPEPQTPRSSWWRRLFAPSVSSAAAGASS